MKTLPLMLVLGLFLQPSAPVPKLPDTPQGALVGSYLEAFNSGKEAEMRRFLETHLGKSGLEQVPVEARLGRFRQMKERLGTLTVTKVLAAGVSSIKLRVKSQAGLSDFTFDLEPTSPPTLRGIMVEDVEEAEGSGGNTEPLKDDQELVEAVARYLADASSRDEFSGVALIAKGDIVLFEKAYGLADKEAKTPNRIDTRFNIGSINKVFTNIAIAQLIGQGKLAMSDTIGKILPDYPNQEAARKITIEQLLFMTSGIGDFFGERFEQTPKEKIKTIRDYFPLFADKPLEFEPGTNRRYSNGGFIVLGAIIEKASGTDYYSYVREHIYRPAGMTHSDSYEKDSLPPNAAIGYTRQLTPDARERVPNYASLPGRGSSAGGGYSTVHDLRAFVRALEEGKLSSREFPPRGIGAAGGAPGLNAVLESTGDYVIVVMSNYDPPTAEKVGHQIRGLLPRN